MNEFPYLTEGNAFFRRAKTPFREKYLAAKTEILPDVSRYEADFDFEPDDLSKLDIDKLIGECDIDYMVVPVDEFSGARCGSAPVKVGVRRSSANLRTRSLESVTSAVGNQAVALPAFRHFNRPRSGLGDSETRDREAEKLVNS